MSRTFYSYDDGEMYALHAKCPLDILFDEVTDTGALIIADNEKLEVVEYLHGEPIGFKTVLVRKDRMAALKKLQNEVDRILGILTRQVRKCL